MVLGVDQAELVVQGGFLGWTKEGFGGGPGRVGRPRRVCGVEQVWGGTGRVGKPKRVLGVGQAELVDQGGFWLSLIHI